MKRIPRKLKLIGGAILVFGIISFFTYIASPLARNHIPDSFANARNSAATIAEGIVNSLNETSQSLKTVQDYEKQRQLASALDIVMSQSGKNKQVSDQATQLALELEKMARSIPEISPDHAAQTALVAISSEAALINQLIAYTNDLNQLLALLNRRFQGSYVKADDINKVIESINQRTDSINSLNQQFVELMQNFDQNYQAN